jgi:hypothetical protein
LVTNRTIRIYFTLIAVWFIASLIFAGQLTSTFDFGTPQFLANLLILISSPALPILWVWLMERSPWQWQFFAPTILVGVVAAILLADSYGEALWFIPVIWSAVASLSARLLKPASRISSLNWRQAVITQAPIPIVIDHGKYLRLLDDQAVAGFPSVMRVRAHFVGRLPTAIASLKDNGPVPGQKELSEQMSTMREFMVGKASCELAFLCAMAFFERMCGPDFRHTKQYQLLVTQLTEIDGVAEVEAWKGQFKELSCKAVTAADLTAVLKILDSHKERDKTADGIGRADNAMITLCALVVLVKAGLINRSDNVLANSDFTKMTIGAINQMRETFARQTTQLPI